MLETTTLLLALIALLTTLILGGTHRIFFSRLSHIPGPKLAALTYWYQAYFDLWPHQGRWLFQQVALHARYGPIVRVGPDEIHISDPTFYAEFAGSHAKKRDKSPLWYWFSGSGENIDGSAFATLGHDAHRVRRAPLNGFFAPKKVRELEGRVRGHVEKLVARLKEMGERGEVVDLLPLTSALTLDVISDYSFGKSTNSLDTDDLGRPVRLMLENGVKIHPFARRFKTLVLVMLKTMSFAARYIPGSTNFADFIQLVDDLALPVYQAAIHNAKDSEAEGEETSIIQALALNKTLPLADQTYAHARAEALNLIGAGTETTGRTLAVGLYHILSNPSIHRRIETELRSLPVPAALASATQLAALPYLTACIHESLRLAHGVAGRLVRIAPDADVVYATYRIPRGTTFSMSHYIQHTSPAYFPEPEKFAPERYLGDGPRAAEALRHLVPFGKGPRVCLGASLAWSEMYLALAAVLGPGSGVRLEVFGTGEEDVKVTREYFIGLFPAESKGVRVRVGLEGKEE